MDISRFYEAIKSLDEMLEYLDKKGHASKMDGIGLSCYNTGENCIECSIEPIGWHRKDFDSIEEFIEYMEKKKWKKEYNGKEV